MVEEAVDAFGVLGRLDLRWDFAGLLETTGEITLVAPGQMHEAEIKCLVDGVGRVTEAEQLYAGIDSVAAGLLQNGCGVDVEPAHQIRAEGFDDWLDGSFEAGA